MRLLLRLRCYIFAAFNLNTERFRIRRCAVYRQQDSTSRISFSSSPVLDGGTGGARPTRAFGLTSDTIWQFLFFMRTFVSIRTFFRLTPSDHDRMVNINKRPLYFVLVA
jgi:hypothetical protein